jgi:hypothetical protein
VLHLPRTGDGMFYLGQGRFQINAIPIKNIKWTGDSFEFRMDARFGPECGVHVRREGQRERRRRSRRGDAGWCREGAIQP